jgi:hypothetical protein
MPGMFVIPYATITGAEDEETQPQTHRNTSWEQHTGFVPRFFGSSLLYMYKQIKIEQLNTCNSLSGSHATPQQRVTHASLTRRTRIVACMVSTQAVASCMQRCMME